MLPWSWLLAGQVTVVGVDGRLVYESLVLPDNQVADYNTRFSGITKKDLGERWSCLHNEWFGNIVISAKGNVVDLGTTGRFSEKCIHPPSWPPPYSRQCLKECFFSVATMKTVLSAIVLVIVFVAWFCLQSCLIKIMGIDLNFGLEVQVKIFGAEILETAALLLLPENSVVSRARCAEFPHLRCGL